jgi:hypothetical protein
MLPNLDAVNNFGQNMLMVTVKHFALFLIMLLLPLLYAAVDARCPCSTTTTSPASKGPLQGDSMHKNCRCY